MVLFTLISQTPLVPLREPSDLVKRNKVTLMLGVAIYLAFAALLYTGKLPESIVAMLPEPKILAGIVVADLILYAGIHRFQYGIFPIFSEDPEMKRKSKKQRAIMEHEEMRDKEEDDVGENDDEDTITNSLKQKGGGRKRRSRKQTEQLKALALDQAQTQQAQRPVPIEDEDISEDQYLEENEDEEPNELSMAEQDFFQNKNKTIVENWDVEDFSNMEMV